MIKVSIIVPVFNTYPFLNRCLDSLANQTLKDIEIILVNDASTDNSLSILKEYNNKYNHFILLNLPENVKQGGAKNAGINLARGKYIGFVDSDDWVEPEMYQLLYQEAERTDSDIVDSDYYKKHSIEDNGVFCISAPKEQFGKMNDSKIKSFILQAGPLVTKIYKRDLWQKNLIKFPEKLFYEDNGMGGLLFALSEKTSKVEKPLYNYFVNNSSTTRAINNFRYFDRLETAKLMVSRYKEKDLYDKFREEIDFRFTEFYLLNTIPGCYRLFKPPLTRKVDVIYRDFKAFMPNFKDNKYYQGRKNIQKLFLLVAIKYKGVMVFLYKIKSLIKMFFPWFFY